MSDNIYNAIGSALEGNAVDFKAAIQSELESKVQDALLMRKIQLGNTLFNNSSDEEDASGNHNQIEFKTDAEENVDEDL